MITNSAVAHAVNPFTALPIGQSTSGPRDAVTQNSSIKPIEPLSSSGKTSLRVDDSSSGLPEQKPSSESDRSGNASQTNNALSEKVGEETREARATEGKAQVAEKQDQEIIDQLSSRDREVRAHEQAHASIGGQYAGAPKYQFERGPDGVSYAVSGKVSIDVSKEPTPQETLIKAEIVRRAALAPAEPSPADRQVAAEATRIAAEARAELNAQRTQEAQRPTESGNEEEESSNGLSNEVSGIGSEPGLSSSKPLKINASTGTNDYSSNQIRSGSNSSGLAAIERLNSILSSSDINATRPGSILNEIV